MNAAMPPLLILRRCFRCLFLLIADASAAATLYADTITPCRFSFTLLLLPIRLAAFFDVLALMPRAATLMAARAPMLMRHFAPRC